VIPLKIDVPGAQTVSALLSMPRQPSACVVLAHGAGAGMNHPFMSAVAEGLADRSIATLRYQFPLAEDGRRRPDAPPLAQATVRAAVTEAGRQLPSVPLFAGGKSFGGRMTSQAQAAEPLPNVSGLVFLGFPLHAAGKPSVKRADHLSSVAVPMLFLQGTRDALAELLLIKGTVARLSASATLDVIEGADHSFLVPVRSGRTDAQVMTGMLDTLSAWFLAIARPESA
jgi:predicted alpha/beta-hydrolase family hydrolase